MSFYNTINLSGEELQVAEKKAMSQEEVVRDIFKVGRKRTYSPSEIKVLAGYVYRKDCPLTSWRRAMTNLTSDGILIKTEEKRVGPYGTPEHYWRLNIKKGQIKMFE